MADEAERDEDSGQQKPRRWRYGGTRAAGTRGFNTKVCVYKLRDKEKNVVTCIPYYKYNKNNNKNKNNHNNKKKKVKNDNEMMMIPPTRKPR